MTLCWRFQKAKFDAIFDGQKKKSHAAYDVDLTSEDLEAIIRAYQQLVETESGRPFPQDPKEQLMAPFRQSFAHGTTTARCCTGS